MVAPFLRAATTWLRDWEHQLEPEVGTSQRPGCQGPSPAAAAVGVEAELRPGRRRSPPASIASRHELHLLGLPSIAGVARGGGQPRRSRTGGAGSFFGAPAMSWRMTLRDVPRCLLPGAMRRRPRPAIRLLTERFASAAAEMLDTRSRTTTRARINAPTIITGMRPTTLLYPAPATIAPEQGIKIWPLLPCLVIAC